MVVIYKLVNVCLQLKVTSDLLYLEWGSLGGLSLGYELEVGCLHISTVSKYLISNISDDISSQEFLISKPVLMRKQSFHLPQGT